MIAEKPKEFVFRPAKGAGPFPVAVWLHGYRGYSPDRFSSNAAEMQKHADALGMVILGFPATTDLEDNTQQWSEEPVADHAYVQARLRLLEKKEKLDLKRVALFGFSQGALVAGDLASHYPEAYLGAVLMSPGGIGEPKLSEAMSPAHQRQVYYCLCGADEAEGNVALTKFYAQKLRGTLGAKVTLQLAPGVERHTLPPDFVEKFPEWMASIFKGNLPTK